MILLLFVVLQECMMHSEATDGEPVYRRPQFEECRTVLYMYPDTMIFTCQEVSYSDLPDPKEQVHDKITIFPVPLSSR